jgi:ABC-type transport system involved in multi-copper enzyme maturation permease subunit
MPTPTKTNLSRSESFKPHPVRALFAREFRAALINRYFQILCALGLAGGIACATFSEDAAATGAFYLQIALYFVSLFALLAGLGSAQSEREEWQLLFTQPLPRPVFVVGKFAALLSIFAGVLILFFLPSLSTGWSTTLLWLYLQTLLLAGAFLALGLAAGYFAHDRAQSLIVGVSAWLLLLCGIDLIALFAARWSTIQQWPDLWVTLLMLNPLDSFRIEALFALEQIPAEAANKTPLANWWITHAGAWFAIIAAFWSVALVSLAGLRLNRWEE